MKSLLPDVDGIDFSGDNFAYEKHLLSLGYNRITGCDEVGRGPLAGPVVAAAVILPPDSETNHFLDSKKLSFQKREKLYKQLIEANASIGIGIVSEKVIDKINILQASLLAMKLACENLQGKTADFVLVDGKFTIPAMDIPQLPLVKGETRSGSIAAASIIAKQTRDRLMAELHDLYPSYNFLKNKGYPTREHRAAIKKHGPCPIHRRSFHGVKEYA